jgi:hypothetical protein
MLTTKARTRGNFVVRRSIASTNWLWYVSTGVIAPSVGAQRSLAPIRIVTYSARCDTASPTCRVRSAILAPDFASL